MELLQLGHFRVLARTQHMTKAAEELYVSQPALSQTIKRLEAELGVPLFDRPGRQIRLNQFGKAFLTHVEQAFFALEEGQRLARGIAHLDQGEVALASAALRWLSEPLRDFLAEHPAATFRLVESALPEMQRQLETGEIDFGFTPAPIQAPGLRWRRLLTEEVYLAVPPEHRLAQQGSVPLEDIAQEPMLWGRKGCYLREIMDFACREAGFNPKIVCETDEAAIYDLVKAGLGSAFTHALRMPPQNAQEVTQVRVTHPTSYLTLGIAWHEAHHLSGSACLFRDFIQQRFAGSRQASPVPAGVYSLHANR